jgi:hypothetical protein
MTEKLQPGDREAWWQQRVDQLTRENQRLTLTLLNEREKAREAWWQQRFSAALELIERVTHWRAWPEGGTSDDELQEDARDFLKENPK